MTNLARYLKEETSLQFVSVSLDGARAETHDRFRGVSGAFEAALGGLGHLVDAGYQPQVIMSSRPIHSRQTCAQPEWRRCVISPCPAMEQW